MNLAAYTLFTVLAVVTAALLRVIRTGKVDQGTRAAARLGTSALKSAKEAGPAGKQIEHVQHKCHQDLERKGK